MDLIYTNTKRVDQGVLSSYALDLSFGAEENDFELLLGEDEPLLDFGAFLYVEGTEYGGIVDGLKTNTGERITTYTGRTWHGILNSKVIEPDLGEDHLVVSGEANEVLSAMVDRLGLSDLFRAVDSPSGINVQAYQFHRYCLGYDGIRDMLEANGAKLRITWIDRQVLLSAVPLVDYTKTPVDSDMATLSVERYATKVNHLVCLGRGELADREVIHLYVDQFGRIGNVQYYIGLDEVTDVYSNTDVASSEELLNNGLSRLAELRDSDRADISIQEDGAAAYDIGDVVGASDIRSGITVAATLKQKIVRINNGVVSTEYNTGS